MGNFDSLEQEVLNDCDTCTRCLIRAASTHGMTGGSLVLRRCPDLSVPGAFRANDAHLLTRAAPLFTKSFLWRIVFTKIASDKGVAQS